MTDLAAPDSAALAELVQNRPRRFAIRRDDRVEWGLEFPNHGGAITCSPGSTSATYGNSAAQIFSAVALLGPAKLVWLD